MTRRGWMALMTVVMAAAACGGGGARSASPTTASTTAAADTTTSLSAPSTTGPDPSTTQGTIRSTATTRLPSTAPGTGPGAVALALSDGDGGRTVTLHRGDTVTVVLHSTYWSFLAPSNAAVLEPQGAPVVAPILPPGCAPGGGCGTVTARYRAATSGSAQLAAHRDSCGEALRCGASQQDWRVTVAVG